MGKVRLFRHGLIEESEIPLSEADNTSHFRMTYKRNNLPAKMEKVDSDGRVIETSIFHYSPHFACSTHFDGDGRLKSRAYELLSAPHSIFEGTKVIFDSNGQVAYPINTKPEQKRLEVLDTVHVGPGTDLIGLNDFSGGSVQLFLPRNRDFYSIDHEELRRALADSEITVALAHGYAIDVFREDFVADLAWIRGNYGVETITLHPLRGDYGSAKRLLEQKREELEGIGVNVSYENLDSNNRWLTSPEDILGLDLPCVSSTLDLSHLPPSTDLLSLVERIFDKLTVVHLSNQSGSEKHLPYRQGVLPAAEFLRVLKANGYEGKIVLEYAPKYREQQSIDLERVREIIE